jgi:hypothetical protein
VAFHVEIRRGRRWAREFNVAEARLRREILEPWTAGRAVRLGDREWEPAECSLRILEGPELAGPDLAFGRGWDRAERTGSDATGELVTDVAREAATVAVLAETDAGREAVLAALLALGIRAFGWPAPDPPAALVLAVETADPPRDWLFEAGAAVGAVGRRAVVVRLGDSPEPRELADLVTADPGSDLASAVAEALGKLGSG